MDCGDCNAWTYHTYDAGAPSGYAPVDYWCITVTGSKAVYTQTCSTHGMSGQHYYCTTHNYVGTSSTHTCCSHGYTSQH